MWSTSELWLSRFQPPLSEPDGLCWLLETSVQEEGTLRAICWSHSACRREAAKIESESMHVYHTLVPFSLFAKEKPMFHVLIPIRHVD